MNLRIYCVLPLCLLFACDKTERDWSKCSDAAACAQGYTCSPDYLCVLAVDAAAEVAAPAADAGGLEVAGLDTADAPLDVAVALDVAVDVAVADAVADLSVDRRPVDSQGSCSSDNDCPDSGPLCLAFRCAKCKTSNDCLSRADSGAGGGVCEPTSGRCVACAKSSDCTADPTKPVCVGNLCVACSSAANECRVKNPSAPVCANNGKCVGCLVNSDCTSSADGGVDGGADGGAAAGFCNTTTNQCVGCLEHDDCSDPNKPICGSSQTCVGCGSPGVSAGTCATKKPAVPVCKPDTGACVQSHDEQVRRVQRQRRLHGRQRQGILREQFLYWLPDCWYWRVHRREAGMCRERKLRWPMRGMRGQHRLQGRNQTGVRHESVPGLRQGPGMHRHIAGRSVRSGRLVSGRQRCDLLQTMRLQPCRRLRR